MIVVSVSFNLFCIDPEMVKSVAISIDADLSVIVPNDMEIMDNEERGQEGTLIREIYTDGEPFEDHLGALIRVRFQFCILESQCIKYV